MNQFENPSAYKDQVIATGLPASPGAAIGQIVFTAEDAEAWNAQGKPAILVQNTEEVDFFPKCIYGKLRNVFL
jgi:phosphoenolpyruvate synthase/pyruvate phosphate dikinase